jgi:hypothetical protein
MFSVGSKRGLLLRYRRLPPLNIMNTLRAEIPTPRTDAAKFGTGRVTVAFAKQLERENIVLAEKLRMVFLALERAGSHTHDCDAAALYNRINNLSANLTAEKTNAWRLWLELQRVKSEARLTPE